MATRIEIGPYVLEWAVEPEVYERRNRGALQVDEIGTVVTAKHVATLAVYTAPVGDPLLLIVVGHDPWYDGHQPNVGILLVPETHVLFVGAGDAVLAYDLHGPVRLWREEALYGFWNWQRHGDYVLMAAEMELAAWDTHGIKRWETFVKPPYDYTVADGTVHLTVMGVPAPFALAHGPAWGGSLPWTS